MLPPAKRPIMKLAPIAIGLLATASRTSPAFARGTLHLLDPAWNPEHIRSLPAEVICAETHKRSTNSPAILRVRGSLSCISNTSAAVIAVRVALRLAACIEFIQGQTVGC